MPGSGYIRAGHFLYLYLYTESDSIVIDVWMLMWVVIVSEYSYSSDGCSLFCTESAGWNVSSTLLDICLQPDNVIMVIINIACFIVFN